MRGKASRSGPGGEIGEAPPAADAARRFRGSAPIGGRDSGRQSVGTTVGKRTPPLRTAWRLVRRADVGIGPYGRFDKKVPAWNPPVTASPCQPPLGKGAEGTGDADCHDQFANWSRNDMVYYGRKPPRWGLYVATNIFLFSCKFILEKQLGICYTLHYSGNKFLSA